MGSWVGAYCYDEENLVIAGEDGAHVSHYEVARSPIFVSGVHIEIQTLHVEMKTNFHTKMKGEKTCG